MELERPNNFEEEWKDAFDDASFAPPNDMWERIERELDKKERRPFLFFFSSSGMLAGIAATLILVLGGILFFMKTPSDNLVTSSIATTPKSINQTPQSIQKTIEESNPIALNSAEPAISMKEKALTAMAETRFSKRITNHNNYTQELAVIGAPFSANSNSEINERAVTSLKVSSISEGKIAQMSALLAQNNQPKELQFLVPKTYQYFGSRYTLKRNKLLFDVPEEEESKNLASNDSKFWLGVQSGVSPFDPNMKLNNLNTVALAQADNFAQVSNKPSVGASPSGDKQGQVLVSQPENAIRGGIGINTGVAMGYKISKKWNFESGICYLRGNSTLNSNTYAFQQNGYVNTFFADYLLQNSASKEYSIASSTVNTVVADASKFGNRYEYLMVPLQMGYEIAISKKVGLNVLAGISADIFLQNTIINDNSLVQEKSTINGSSNIYKPLNMSGLGGLRATYLIDKHWQLNLGSSYQHSLFSGINNSTDLQMRLKMFGLNYGLNYRF